MERFSSRPTELIYPSSVPVVNPLGRELVFKIVFCGPGLGGKTTTLQRIHASTKPEHRGKMVSLATPVDRTLYFDYLPIRLPDARNLAVRLQLFTVPGQVYYNATRRLVLTGADGVVLVADSQRVRLDANLESLDNLIENLHEHGRDLSEMPHVMQYNKRDLPDILAGEALDEALNRHQAPSVMTAAVRGDGVFEVLEAITAEVLKDFQLRLPEEEGATMTLELPEGGLTEALKAAEQGPSARPETPRPPRPDPGEPLHLRLDHEPSPGEEAARRLAADPEAVSLSAGFDEGTEGNEPIALNRPRAGSVLPAFSFDALWPGGERPLVAALEAALTEGDLRGAVLACEQLVSRSLARAAGLLGQARDAPRDPAVVVLLLGVDGRRYLEFRALVRQARSGRDLTRQEALLAYAFAIEIRLVRARFEG